VPVIISTRSGTVREVVGQAIIRRPDGIETPLLPGAPVRAGDIILTRQDSIVEIVEDPPVPPAVAAAPSEIAGTIAAIERTLLAGPVVFRYHEDDGLPGVEGGMLICAGWLIESLAMVGRRDDAKAMLDKLASLVGPTGIAPEQYCPRHKIALGNIAQAYSHLAIINAAVRLSQS